MLPATKRIIRDIEALHGDTSVPDTKTLDELEEIEGVIEGMIDGLREQIKRRGREATRGTGGEHDK